MARCIFKSQTGIMCICKNTTRINKYAGKKPVISVSATQNQKTSKENLSEKKEEKDMLTKVKCHSNGALSEKLGAFFNESHFHDVVLKLPNKEYKAHRLVLCVWSDYF
ncbi:hypothetical protein BSL78_25533 [Apostichopus japonicus]|uniref:BTB domain-containing protein n=1 Tax=Stichopus japonicus TaxID=307972 RepID=A0A2G8JPC7_STIJA|nr:hypothetical protein BSL78_25533 [Apostichopus japonicus]